MTHPTLLQVLYVGRKVAISNHLRAIFDQQNQIAGKQSQPQEPDDEAGSVGEQIDDQPAESATTAWTPVNFVATTNQQAALQLIRLQPPTAVFVELEQKPSSRRRLCEMVRYRLPTATILAVATQLPNNTFAFDGLIRTPLVSKAVIDAVAKLGIEQPEYQLQLGPITLNMATRTVISSNGQYTMTPKQCALLKLLMTEHGKVVERGRIMEMVWETSFLEDTRTLDVHIRWLRERIEPNPSKPIYLKTVRGVGYRFSVHTQ